MRSGGTGRAPLIQRPRSVGLQICSGAAQYIIVLLGLESFHFSIHLFACIRNTPAACVRLCAHSGKAEHRRAGAHRVQCSMRDGCTAFVL